MALTQRSLLEVPRLQSLNYVGKQRIRGTNVPRGKRKRKAVVESTPISVEEKIGRAIATLLIKDMEPEEAAVRLSGIGFSASDISTMLLVNKNYVNVAKNRWKKRQKAKIRQSRPR
jgi:hypothetical protein